MKKIIHFQLPTNENGTSLISVRKVREFHRYLKKILPRYYLTIFSPFQIDIKGSKVKFDITKFEGKIPKESIEKMKDTIEKEGYIVEIIK